MPDLGHVPKAGYDVILVPGNDWIQSGRRSDGQPWPDGTVITVVLGAVAAWPAIIDGPDVRWNVDKADVDAVIADITGTPPARIDYRDAAGLDLTLTRGKVRVRG